MTAPGSPATHGGTRHTIDISSPLYSVCKRIANGKSLDNDLPFQIESLELALTPSRYKNKYTLRIDTVAEIGETKVILRGRLTPLRADQSFDCELTVYTAYYGRAHLMVTS